MAIYCIGWFVERVEFTDPLVSPGNFGTPGNFAQQLSTYERAQLCQVKQSPGAGANDRELPGLTPLSSEQAAITHSRM